MRLKVHLVSWCLVSSVILIGCGFTPTPEPTEGAADPTKGAAVVYLPEGARQALEDHIARVVGPDFEYSVVSAQRTTQIEPIASGSIEQAWCIAIDKMLTCRMQTVEVPGVGEQATIVDSWSYEYNVLLAFSRRHVWVAGPIFFHMASYQRLDAGCLHVLYGSVDRLSRTGVQSWYQDGILVEDAP